jgi:aspartate kinase
MEVHKYGGAAVRDADGVRNLLDILHSHKTAQVIVVSAFGKTTNRLEEITRAIYNKERKIFFDRLKKLKAYHKTIVNGLFIKDRLILVEIEQIFDFMTHVFMRQWECYDHLYDQIVCLGEILSTKIVYSYLYEQGMPCRWLDIRKNLVTDAIFRNATVNWEESSRQMVQHCLPKGGEIVITQGFIGGTKQGVSTTLGREGSDYTGALLAGMLNAEKLIIWKDVPGIMNADPRYFRDASKLEQISYQEAIELAYYGAKILHPKTIKPLQNQNIPLVVKSFSEPEEPGTLIGEYDHYDGDKPIFILKKNQILVSVFPKDLSFAFESVLSHVCSQLAYFRIKVNLVQQSAISFSFCTDEQDQAIFKLIETLRRDYKVLYNTGLELLTIRHYTGKVLVEAQRGRKILLEQRSRHTTQFLMA